MCGNMTGVGGGGREARNRDSGYTIRNTAVLI